MAMDLACYIKNLIEEAGLKNSKEEFDCKGFCENVGMDTDNLIRALLILFIKQNKENMILRDEVSRITRENEMLNESFENVCKNRREKQMALVQSGLPIAIKTKKSLADLRLRLHMGETDKEIMEAFDISRTTLWRWKKELEEEQRNIDKIIKQSPKWNGR